MEVQVALHEQIYSLAAIRKAVNDYQAIARISYCQQGKYTICLLSDCVLSEEQVKNEFVNYVLALTVKREGF